MSACVCGSGRDFDDCCGPILDGQPAPTAEALMRSRYAAHTLCKIEHIERTNTPEANVDFNPLDSERFAEQAEWVDLKILNTVDGGPEDETGSVEFLFRYKLNRQLHMHRELSQFCRRDGLWLYESSDMNPKGAPLRVEKQPGRNDPCPCGSSKKYKKCCGA